MKKIVLLLWLLLALCASVTNAHTLKSSDLPAKNWQLKNGTIVQGWFMMVKDKEIYLELKNGAVAHYNLNLFSNQDQSFALNKYSIIKKENESLISVNNTQQITSISNIKIAFAAILFLMSLYFIFRLYQYFHLAFNSF
jgi:hypothetical protein